MKKHLIVIAILIAIPTLLFGEIIQIGVDAPTLEDAVLMAEDGDTLILQPNQSFEIVNLDGKDLVVGVDALEPEGAVPDESIYGPNNPMPISPVE